MKYRITHPITGTTGTIGETIRFVDGVYEGQLTNVLPSFAAGPEAAAEKFAYDLGFLVEKIEDQVEKNDQAAQLAFADTPEKKAAIKATFEAAHTAVAVWNERAARAFANRQADHDRSLAKQVQDLKGQGIVAAGENQAAASRILDHKASLKRPAA